MAVEQNDAIDVYNVLSLYSTHSIIKRAKCVRMHDIEQVYADTDGMYEFLVTVKEASLPHTVIIGADDIWCSCTGFISSLKCSLLCTHLVICFVQLYQQHLLMSSDIVMYMNNWKNRNDCNN